MSTTVCVDWLTLQRRRETSCNVSSMQPLESCQTAVVSITVDSALFQRHVLHWLDVADQIRFRLCVQVFKYQHSMAPGYLAELCRPVSSIDGHWHLQPARCGQLDFLQVRLSTYGRHVFCRAGLSAWNALFKNNALSLSNFIRQLKHYFLLLVLFPH